MRSFALQARLKSDLLPFFLAGKTAVPVYFVANESTVKEAAHLEQKIGPLPGPTIPFEI